MQTRRSGLLLAGAIWLSAALITATSVLAPPASARQDRQARQARAERNAELLRRIARMRGETWRWQRLMGRPLTRHVSSAARSTSFEYRRWVLRLWMRRAEAARRRAQHPARLEAWLCIHRYEAPWNDPNPPYYGGLQMDLGFQRTYGADLLRRKGTADHWTPLEQIWVAERAYRRGRGFYPWPNTARSCGLI